MPASIESTATQTRLIDVYTGHVGFRSKAYWKLRSLSPQVAARVARLVGRPELIPPTYQVVRVEKQLSRLHTGTFSDAHEMFVSRDSHLGFDSNVTRLRSYFTCSFLELALNLRRKRFVGKGDPGGGVLVAGASFGTMAKTFSQVCNLTENDVELWVIDPLDGRGGSSHNYNLQVENLLSGFAEGLNVNFRPEAIPEALNTIFDKFFFFHFNTGDFDVEVASLPWIFRHAEETAILVLDSYGWQSNPKQQHIDQILTQAGWCSFVLPTYQLIAYPASIESTATQTRLIDA